MRRSRMWVGVAVLVLGSCYLGVATAVVVLLLRAAGLHTVNPLTGR